MPGIYENYTTGGSSGRPDYEIGPSQGSMQLLNRLARQPSRDLPSAIAQIGAAFIQAHGKKTKAEAQRAAKQEQAKKRGGWAVAIGEGASVQEIASRDPSIIDDTAFLGFLSKNRPEAATETFETVQNPYGRGGVAQASSVSGKYSGYQGPLAPKGPPETMVDKAGFHRYLGGDMHGQRVFPDVEVPAEEPKIAPAILAYEQAKARGHIEPGISFEDYKNFGRTQNTFQMRTAAPAPASGYKNVFDDAGNFVSQELIPGSPAALKIEKAQLKIEAQERTTAQRGSIVSQHAQGIRKLMEESTFPVTGLFSVTQSVPGIPAHDVSKRVETLQAIAGFDQLNRMRQESPTGGALGQVSERELKFLQSVIGSLELSQSKGQFLENLARVEATFNEIVHGGGAPQPQPQLQAADSPGVAALTEALLGPLAPSPSDPASAALGQPMAPQQQAPQQQAPQQQAPQQQAPQQQAPQQQAPQQQAPQQQAPQQQAPQQQAPQQQAPQQQAPQQQAPQQQAPQQQAPQQQAPQASGEMSPAGETQSIEMYASLPKDELQRKAMHMRDNPNAYSDAEKRAAALAWQRVFGGE